MSLKLYLKLALHRETVSKTQENLKVEILFKRDDGNKQ